MLEEVVAKLQALGDKSVPPLQEKPSLPAVSLVSALGDAPSYREEQAPSCLWGILLRSVPRVIEAYQT